MRVREEQFVLTGEKEKTGKNILEKKSEWKNSSEKAKIITNTP